MHYRQLRISFFIDFFVYNVYIIVYSVYKRTDMEKDKLIYKCFDQFRRILNSFNEVEKRSMDFGTGDLLYPSEIHTLEAIGSSNEHSISDLARILGITRGAVQKLSVKLNKKGYLNRFMSSDDSKRIYLKLTEKGQKACIGHSRFHEEMNNRILSMLDMLNKTELEKTISVFEVIEKYFSDYLNG